MNSRVIIYGLVDPRNGTMRYVGRTRAALKTRLASHKADTALDWTGKARGYSLDKVKWLVELKEAGLSPTIRVLEEVAADGAIEAERRWVQSLFKAGVPLTNRQWRPPSCYDSPEWLRGYATALVDLHRHCGQAATVRSVIEASGIVLDKFKRAGVEELDLKELAKCYARKHRA